MAVYVVRQLTPAQLRIATDVCDRARTLPDRLREYGLGDIRLRLTAVGDGKPVHESAEWVQVAGVERRGDDSELGPRSALVRVAALVRR
jgi:hypothetical protein